MSLDLDLSDCSLTIKIEVSHFGQVCYMDDFFVFLNVLHQRAHEFVLITSGDKFDQLVRAVSSKFPCLKYHFSFIISK